MLKKTLLLLLSASALVAVPNVGSAEAELTKRQRVAAYAHMTILTLFWAAKVGESAVSCLPKNTSNVVKAAVFIPSALLGAGMEAYILKDTDMLGFYKRHKWLLLGL